MDRSLLELLGYSRSEFERVKNDMRLSSRVEVVTALSAFAAIFSAASKTLFSLALIAAVTAGAASFFRIRSGQRKATAERGRRSVVLAHGLGRTIDGKDYSDLKASFTASQSDAEKWADPDYYASLDPPGPRRLASVVQESAFWSRALFTKNATLSWVTFIAFALTSFGLLFVIVSIPSQEWRIKLAQIVCLILSTLFARDHIGDAVGFASASTECDSIDRRLEELRKTDSTLEDVLLAFGDYNCVLEVTPPPKTSLYAKERDKLAELWSRR